MKSIKLYDTGKYTSKEVLRQALGLSPQKPITYIEMGKRLKLLDLIEAADKEVVVEDADHSVLLQAIEGFPWSLAERELHTVLKAVHEAKEPEKKAKADGKG